MNIPIINRQTDLLKKIIINVKIKEFIEIGCGEGHNLKLFSKLGLNGTGIDISEKAINIAKSLNLKGIKLIQDDLQNLNYRNKNTIFLLFVLEHIKNDNLSLRKINTLLKIKGNLILSVPAHTKAYSFQDKLAGHYRRYNKNEIVTMLKNNGFITKKIYSFGFPISNIYTKMYNIILSLKYKELDIQLENTKITGIKNYKKHFPAFIKYSSNFIFKILNKSIKLDSLFLNTNLGTHYIILAEKIKDLQY